MHCMQVYVSTEVASEVGGLKALTSTGTSILVQGTLQRTPQGTLQVHIPCQHRPLLMPHSCLRPILTTSCDIVDTLSSLQAVLQ